MKNEKNDYTEITDIHAEGSYVEEGELVVLATPAVLPDEKPEDPKPRWRLLADPVSRKLKRIDFCVATEEGFDYPPFEPSDKQMALFEGFVQRATA